MRRRESKPLPQAAPDGTGTFSRRGGGGALPLLLLAAALSYIFVFGERRGYFFWMHDWSSSNNMAVAANLSPDHNFVGFNYRRVDRSGDPRYGLYNRFPIGAAVLTKLAIAPFAGDLSAQIFAAKTLSVLLFCGAALLAYLTLGRLFRDRWSAAAAVLLAFSSWYALVFADMVGEGMVSLFGTMLAFHGLAVFVQEGRFRQLLVKTCAALLLGWHVAGLVLAFVVLGAGAAAVGRTTTDVRPRFARIALYGGISFVFAMFVMSINFLAEYRMAPRERAFMDLPSVESALNRTGIFDRYGVRSVETMTNVLKQAITRVGDNSIPFAFFDPDANTARGAKPKAPVNALAAGFVVLATVCAGLFFVGHRIVVASFVLSGFAYGQMAVFNLWHAHEGVHYIPVSLIFYLFIAHLGRRALEPRFASALYIASAAAIFGASNVKMSRVTEAAPRAGEGGIYDVHRANDDLGREASAFYGAMLRDFDAIRAVAPRGARIYVAAGCKLEERIASGGASGALWVYLSGYVINCNDRKISQVTEYRPDFVLSRERVDSPFLVTPENGAAFLYDGAAWCEAAAGDSRSNPARVRADSGLEFPCGG